MFRFVLPYVTKAFNRQSQNVVFHNNQFLKTSKYKLTLFANNNHRFISSTAPINVSGAFANIQTNLCYNFQQTPKKQPKDDNGLVTFLKKVYLTTGLGVATSLSSSYAIITFAPHLIMQGTMVGIVGTFGSIMALFYFPARFNEANHHQLIPDIKRTAIFGTLCVSSGLSISLLVATCFNSSILPMSIFLSVATMGGAIYYAVSTPPTSLSKYGPFLYGTLTGMICMGVISFCSNVLFGPNIFSSVWYTLDTYVGIVLFAALQAYDTQEAIQMYQDKKPDHLVCATSSFLNFINLFVRFISILSGRKLE